MGAKARLQPPNRISHSRQPHVALLIETSLASGRDIVRGIGRYLREHHAWSVYLEPRALDESVPTWLRKWRGDGIIARLQSRKITEAVVASRIPVVDVLGVAHHPRVPLVHVDNAAISRLAAEHLLDRGFRNFGYCGLGGVNWSDERRQAFQASVSSRGECFVYTLPASSRVSWEEEQDNLAEWLRQLPKPCGVMACNDPRGQKVLEAAHRVGIAVPDELAVIGVDNDEPLCEISNPPLTSVHPEHSRVGFEAARLLDRLMQGERLPKKPVYLQPVEVVTRQSTDVLAIEDPELAMALRFIREHASEGIGVEDVLSRLTTSRSAIQRKFRAVLGRTIHDEIVLTRLKKARELLINTEVPLPLVAEKAGFKHQEYLGVVFKAHFSETPAAFRRKNRR